MKRDLEVKQQVLEMLKDFLMSSDGGKFKPKAIEVEVIHPMDEDEDMEDEGGLAEVLKNASKDADEDCGPMDEEEKPKKKSLKDFFDR